MRSALLKYGRTYAHSSSKVRFRRSTLPFVCGRKGHVRFVDELTGTLALVSADDSAGGPIHPAQVDQAVASQDVVDRRGGYTQDRADACGAELAVAPQFADAFFGVLRVRCGVLRGWLERPYRPASPSARQRRTHLWAVVRELPISAATCATGRPACTRPIRRRLPWTVSRALGGTESLVEVVSPRDRHQLQRPAQPPVPRGSDAPFASLVDRAVERG